MQHNSMTASITIRFNHCDCGWWFPAFSPSVLKCPQCKGEVILCRNCGKDITNETNLECCEDCRKLNKKVYLKYHMRTKRAKLKFKTVLTTDNICNYDCANCPYGDCILPVDKDDYYDDETGKLFNDDAK